MHVRGFLYDLNFSRRRPPIPRWKALDDSIQQRAPGWRNQPGSARALYMNEHLESLADDHSTNDDEKIGIDTPDINRK